MKTGIAPGVKIRWIIKAFIADRIRKKYPNAAKRLQQRAEQYNRGVALAEKYEAQGRVLIIAPDDTCGIDTLSKSLECEFPGFYIVPKALILSR